MTNSIKSQIKAFSIISTHSKIIYEKYNFTTLRTKTKKRVWFLQPQLGMNLYDNSLWYDANFKVWRLGNRTRNLAILNSFAKKSSKEKVRKFWEKVSTKDLNKRFPKTLLLLPVKYFTKKVFRISRRASIMHGRGHTKEVAANFATVVQKKVQLVLDLSLLTSVDVVK